MKKIIIAVCSIAFASMVNAATVGWSYGGSISNTSAMETAYEFFVIGQNGVTSSAQILALIGNGESAADYAFGSGTTTAKGVVTVAPASSGKTIDITAAGTLTAFMVVFDNADISKATSYLAILNENCGTANGYSKSVTASTASVNFAAGNVASYVNTASNWTAVPEPTSGLLLLLGMAGLALKRKVA